MAPSSRAVAAVLAPLLACAPGIRVRHRDGVASEVTREAPSAGTVQVAEEAFTSAFRVLGKQAPVWERPLETARRLFEVPERSGTYLYEVRTRRMTPVAPGGPMLGDSSEQEFVRDYLGWCGASLGPGDCLRLLGPGRVYSSHARYATALAIGWWSALGAMRDSLREMVNPAAAVSTLFAAMAMYLMLWTVPEPFSKGVAAAMTIWLVGYFGFDPLWRLAQAWRALVEEADAALDFKALRRAGERFGERAGPGAARVLILVATVAIGGTAGMAGKGPSLPGFSLASAQAEGQLGVSLAAATAAESVLVGTRAVTITFAPGLLAMAATSPEPGVAKGGATGWLLENARQPFKGGDLTRAGRALTKHPEVLGHTKETLRTVLRTDAQINAAAEGVLAKILGGTETTLTLPRYGAVLEFRAANGFGARFHAVTGEFIGFINP